MRILLAEDEPLSRHLVTRLLEGWGYEVAVVSDGDQALAALAAVDGPRLAILDWMMPGMDGTDVCKQVRTEAGTEYTYVILLSAKKQKQDVVAGLDAGADDYITKPFDEEELHSRVLAGERIIKLKGALAHKVCELQDALDHVRQLQGLLPICMHCKKIRDDSNTWHRLETYIEGKSEASFSHALCDECLAKHYPSDD
jgi:sigma-B regulation protein RsbU (phosphoserine phosphatase)